MPLEQWLAIGMVLCFLGFDMVACWMLASGHIDIIRRGFAKLVLKKNHHVESYIKGLKKLAEDNGN